MEIKRSWSIVEVAEANIALDIKEAAERHAHEQAKPKEGGK